MHLPLEPPLPPQLPRAPAPRGREPHPAAPPLAGGQTPGRCQARLPISLRHPLTSRTAAARRRPRPAGTPGAGNARPARLRAAATLLREPGRRAVPGSARPRQARERGLPRVRAETAGKAAARLLGARGLVTPDRASRRRSRAKGHRSEGPTYWCDTGTKGSDGQRER